MNVGQISTKIGNCIENRHIFMLLNCNCAKLANFEDFKTCLRGHFFVDTVYIELEPAALLKAIWWDLRLASLLTHLFV